MTKEFFEIVLSKLITERDMIEMDMENLWAIHISTDEKSQKFIDLLKKLTDINNNIKALTEMLPEEAFFEASKKEE